MCFKFIRRIFGRIGVDTPVLAPDADGTRQDEMNAVNAAYEKMRSARTEENYLLLVRAFLDDVRKNVGFPYPYSVKDIAVDLEKGGLSTFAMNTPVGVMSLIYSSHERIHDKATPTGEDAMGIVYFKCSEYLPHGSQDKKIDGMIFNPYDTYGGVVIARKDIDEILAHREDTMEIEIDAAEGARMNRALAYWWLVECGRYDAPSRSTGHVCSDCAFEYNGGAVCPRCGFDSAVSDVPKVTHRDQWINRYECEWYGILKGVNCGEVDESAAAEFLNRMKARAERNDSIAAHFLGKMIARDITESDHELLLQSARLGNACAMVDLGKVIADHARNEDETFRVIRLYRLAASVGMPTAAKNLARRYAEGIGLKQNKEKAVALSDAAFTAGLVECAFPLSVMCETGNGCPKDLHRAFDYARKGADGGDADSAYQLSRCYRYGIGTEIDLSKADVYLVQALDARSERVWGMWNADGASELDCRVRWAGNDESRWRLILQHAQLYWKEFGYVSLLHRAAEKGFVIAMNDLGLAYAYGYWNGRVDYDEAERWLTRAASLGYPHAHFNLGLLYRDESFHRMDRAKAGSMFLKSAELGHAPAQYHLWIKRLELPSECYMGCSAESWLEKAAEQGYPPAVSARAAQLSESGDDKAAFQLVAQHADAGNPELAFLLGKWYREGRGVEKDVGKSVQYILFAAQNGVPDAMNELGCMYSLGIGVEEDQTKALEWVRKAAAANSPAALCNLANMERAEGRLEEAVELYLRNFGSAGA